MSPPSAINANASTNTAPAASGDGFDTLSVWLAEPEVAFASWLSAKAYRPSSKAVFVAMFNQFSRWMQTKQLPFEAISSAQLASFLDDIGATKEYRYRYLRLLQRVWAHLASLGLGRHGNPASQAIVAREGAGANDGMHFLTPSQSEHLVRWCEAQFECCYEAEQQGELGWVFVRDAALIALLFGAGLKVGRVRGLGVNCTVSADAILVPGRGVGRDREYAARLLPFAADILRRWLVTHRANGLPPTSLFPATPARRRLAANARSPHLSPSSIFRRAKAALEACGVTGKRACPQTLRNSYGAALLAQGMTDAQVAVSMGFVEPQSIKDFKLQYHAWTCGARDVDSRA